MGTPERDQLPCRECGRPFRKRMVEQRHCTNADRGHPELYRGDDSGCFEKTERGQRTLAALEKQERRKQRKADRLWRQRKKVKTALARVDQARRQLAELEAAGEAGPDRRTRGEAGPAKNVRDPSTGQFLRTTPPVEPKPEKQREKRKAWFQCGNRPCIGRMSHPCDGCGIAESPQEAPESPQNGSADRTTRTSTEPENDQHAGSQPPGGDRDQVVLRLVAEAKAERAGQPPHRPPRRVWDRPPYSKGSREEETEERHVTACPRDPAQAQRVLDRLGRESRTAQPPTDEPDATSDEQESLIETTSIPLLEDWSRDGLPLLED